MDGYTGEVHNLRHDVEDHDREVPQQWHRSHSRRALQPGGGSSFLGQGRHADSWSSDPRLRSAEYQQQDSHHAREPFSSYQYDEHYSDRLDDYDRALLAEPPPPTQWTQHNSSGTIAPGRLSLPGHTAPFTPTPAFDQSTARRRRRPNAGPSSNDFKAQLSHFVHTPPKQLGPSSSPTLALPSSPLFNASQRRPQGQRVPRVPINNAPQQHTVPGPNVAPNTKKARTSRLSRNEVDENAGIESSLSNSLSFEPLLQPNQDRTKPGHAPPIIQGIQLISTNDLPDRFRSIFPFNPLNAIQSKCFPTAYYSNDNLVVSAPTGGGKTAIFELAICHLLSDSRNEQYKIVYMAPTKSLCAERQRDWQAKFPALDLVCAELTGDTDFAHLRSVQSASVIITTPEKWDSMTRQWKDHAKLMQIVKLFLIDEVHMLRDHRGATLEAVVSRMKSIGSSVRFIALSATVPNAADVATWLGKDHINQHLPAVREMFGDEFRPVKLQKHIIGLPYKGNDYGFEGICDHELPKIVATYGRKKPLMVFCITRKSAQSTAKYLANVWAEKDPRDRQWPGPSHKIPVGDPELGNALASAVAFHHAGLDANDRHAVEQGFIAGHINVICCTSTLAVGVNLPCHLVIIKNTMSYQGDGLKEYAELEITQMLGRAGRPQFDDSAVAIIITKQEKVKNYEQLIMGGETLESCLHLNLIDHLNAEIGLGTISDLHSAMRWIAGTFLYVRLQENPGHYRLDQDTASGNLEERVKMICQRDLKLLESADLVTVDHSVKATELGHIMARYYVQFQTMKTLLGIGSQAKMSDILSSLVQAEEYQEIRMRSFEKKPYKELNNSSGIKFPIQVDLAMHAHKRSLLIQSELGGVEFPGDEQYAKHRRTFQTEKGIMFSNIHRLVRCVIDIQVHLQDAIGARHALELARSLSAGVWDNSPFQMKQIPQIGPVSIRKLALNRIDSIEALEATEPHRIELLLSKNPPFGSKLLSNLKDFPKLRVSVTLIDKEIKPSRPVSIKVKLECGFLNEKGPVYFNRKPIYICLLTERSDGHLIDFRRISAKKLNNAQDVLIVAEMTRHTQYLTCHVMCEEIAGTLRCAELRPKLPIGCFPASSTPQQHSRPNIRIHSFVASIDDEFGAQGINDQDMVDAVEGQEFQDVEQFDIPDDSHASGKGNIDETTMWNPQRLKNGKWACNHKCKDKMACKHLCCREGLDKAPKAPKATFVPASTLITKSTTRLKPLKIQSRIDSSSMSNVRRKGDGTAIEEIDLADKGNSPEVAGILSRHVQGIGTAHQSLVTSVSTRVNPPDLPFHSTSKDSQPKLSFLGSDNIVSSSVKDSMDYSDEWQDPFPSPSELLNKSAWTLRSTAAADEDEERHASETRVVQSKARDPASLEGFDQYNSDHDDCEFEAAMVGLSDSTALQQMSNSQAHVVATPHSASTGSIDSAAIPQVNKETSSDENSVRVLPTILEKRHAEADTDLANTVSNTAGVKRQRFDSNAINPPVDELAPITKLQQENEPPPVPTIKPGQPDWVYQFDPAFIAEYQDLVEFV